MTPQFSEALASLHPIQRGAGFVARCPAHADKAPSLNVDEVDGKVLVKCHAGCETKDVVEALGLSMTDLFDQEAERVAPLAADKRVVATYDYADEAGALLFQVVRYEPKSFRQRRPDGKGGWTYNLDGVERVPYNLPAVLAATDVVIVEGEKDADRLIASGIVATTNPSGASKWDPAWARYFAGRNVTIIPDNDAPGQKHADEVRLSLEGAARRVYVASLPVPPKGDVSDYLDMGHSVDDLRALLTPGVAPTIDGYIEKYSGAQANDLYADVIPSGGVVVFVGQPRSFKTMAAMQLMFSVASGKRWLGMEPTMTGSCLYVSEEGSRGKIADRLVAMRHAYGPENSIHILHREGITIGGEQWAKVTTSLDEMINPRIVVLDTLAALSTGDENSVADMREDLRHIQNLVTTYGVTVILVHHINKTGDGRMGNRMRGSSALWGACDGTLGFVRDEENEVAEDSGEVRVETKDNDPRRIRFGFSPETMTLKADIRPSCTVANLLREFAEREKEQHGPVKGEEVRDYFGAGKSWFYEQVKGALEVGLVQVSKGYYRVEAGLFSTGSSTGS